MTTFRQVMHLFRKDVRGHWPEIAGLVLLNLTLIVLTSKTWTGVQASFDEQLIDPDLANALQGMLTPVTCVAWLLTIARIVHSDTPASRSQYWLTRPVPRLALLLAKGLYVVVFIHILAVLAHLIILTVSDIPFSWSQLLLNQVALAMVISLPACLLASLTHKLQHFLLIAIPLAIGVSVTIVRVIPQPYVLGEFLNASRVQVVLILTLVAGISLVALVQQYRTRSTLQIALIASILCVLVSVAVRLAPATLSSLAYAALTGPPDELPRLSVANPLDQDPMRSPLDGTGQRASIALFINEPITEHFLLENASIRLTTPAGSSHTLEARASRVYNSFDSNTPKMAWIEFRIPRPLYLRERSNLLSVEIEFDIKQFSNEKIAELPLDGSSAVLDGSEQCGLGAYVYLVCRAGLRGSTQVSLGVGNYTEPEQQQIELLIAKQETSIPLTFKPVSTFSTNLRLWDREQEILPVFLLKPASYHRASIVIDDVRLSEWVSEAGNGVMR